MGTTTVSESQRATTAGYEKTIVQEIDAREIALFRK
jgi:hypothetical protein